MHHPYLAMLWNRTDKDQGACAALLLDQLQREHARWTCRLADTGAAIFDQGAGSSTAKTYVLAGGCGIVYGRLFESGNGTCMSPDDLLVDRDFAEANARSSGALLIDRYFGAYVAILLDVNSDSWVVIRDCSGMLPCYYTVVSGITIVCSDISLITAVVPHFRINWSYLARFLAWPSIQIRETALENVHELLAGELLQVKGARPTTRFAWNPVSISREAITDHQAAASTLRSATALAISAWAAVHGSILHSLSGGFDSSLVLSLLVRSPRPPAITCINRFANGAAEDERVYARISAKACNARLLEISRDFLARPFQSDCLGSPRTAKPAIPYILSALESAFWNELTATTGAQSVWTGQGGDHLFLSARTELGVIDCLRLHGFGVELGNAMRHAAVLTGRSFFSLMARTAAISVSRRSFRDSTNMAPDCRFLSRDGSRHVSEERIFHPWYRDSRSLPPGKRCHVLLIADVINRHRPLPERHAEEIHPLLAQPVLEACLRIPVHVLLSEGKTRGLARRAFASYLPREILAREQKGVASAHFLGTLRNSRRFILELLLDGVLIRQGLLAKQRLATTLESNEPLRSEVFSPLFACVAAEAWVRGWYGGTNRY